MAQFIDRRLNPKDKNLGNRRRFIDRVRNHVKSAVDEAVKRRDIANADREGRVSVPADSINEPAFRHARDGGRRERVLTGNKQFHGGDRLNKPPAGGAGGRGRKGSKDGDGEDDFVFILSREEFLDIFFEDLELPDLIKRTLKELAATRPHRAGLSVTGSPGNLNVERTLRNAMGRRLALHRPTDREIREIRGRIFELEAVALPSEAQRAELIELREALETRQRRQKLVPYLDPLDVRYNHFEQRPEPNANAVMFCLMDVSASMREREKDLAKRFFVLLHLFLMRRYEKVELVFIRHTHQANECDEETFFHSRETGGTVVSTALVEMKRIVDARYPAADWNIYAAQASDGDNYSGDSAGCAAMLEAELMPLCQYFAYVEIIDEEEAQFLTNDRTGTELWLAYRGVAEALPNFAMKRISGPGDIYPVFRELFSRDLAKATDG